MCRFHFLYFMPWDHLEAFHKPSVLLRCYRLDFAYTSWPSEPSVSKPFVKKEKSITFIEQTFYAIRPPSTEKEQIPFLKRIHPELLLDQSGKAIDPAPQICIAALSEY